MTSRLARSAVVIAIAATTTSAAFAESKAIRHDALRAFASVQASQDDGRVSAPSPTRRPMFGAQWFQNNGISEAMRYPYWGR